MLGFHSKTIDGTKKGRDLRLIPIGPHRHQKCSVAPLSNSITWSLLATCNSLLSAACFHPPAHAEAHSLCSLSGLEWNQGWSQVLQVPLACPNQEGSSICQLLGGFITHKTQSMLFADTTPSTCYFPALKAILMSHLMVASG